MTNKEILQRRKAQISKVYAPQEDFIKQQMKAIPGMYEGRKSSLEQAKVNAFRDIGNTAQQRGMFFSGFQPAEQARYLGEKYLPGLQNIDSEMEQGRLGLLEQLIGLRGQKTQSMMDFREQLRQENVARREAERDRQFTASQNAANRASSSANSRQMSVGDQIKLTEFNEKQPRMIVRGSEGGSTQFGFTDRNGNPVSAARYAELTGNDIRTVLADMGRQGDTYAQQVYNQLKNDPNPQKRLGQYKTAYSPLFWGT